MAPLIEIKDLSQGFCLTKGLLQPLRVEKGKIIKKDRVVHAIDKVGFQIEKGEVFGLIGESGYSESTVARTIIRLLELSGGQVLHKGGDTSHLSPRELLPYRKSMQMIFQSPYTPLNSGQRVEDIIMEPMLFHGVTKDKSGAGERCMNILSRVGFCPEQAGRYPHQLSGSQGRHIGVARALAVKPEFIIADGSVSTLGISIQAQILNLPMDLEDEFHFSCLLATHDLSAVRHISDRLGVTYLGALVEVGNKQTLFQSPLHPYTKALFSAVPAVGEEPLAERIGATGEIPGSINLSKERFFYERYPYVTRRCRKGHPEPREIEPGHQAAYHIL